MLDIAIDNIILPNKPLNNLELEDKKKNFRGVFLRNTLPKKCRKKECGILNLGDASGSGTHWVAWYKNGKNKIYFDSYGIQPPLEIRDYIKSPLH